MVTTGIGEIPITVLRRLPKWGIAIESDTTSSDRLRLKPLLLKCGEAAELLSMSLDSFERYVEPEIKLVRRSRLKLVPYSELEKWVGENIVRIGGQF